VTQGTDTSATGQVTELKLASIASFTCSLLPLNPNRCALFGLNPVVTISGGGSSGATATAAKNGTTISFTVTNAGSGYTSRPAIMRRRTTNTNLTLPASSASMGANGVALTASGSGYTGTSFSTAISGNGGSGATATATLGTSAQLLTITALGDRRVTNHAYAGPQASTPPYNAEFITRHYGFGTAPGTVAPECGSDGCFPPVDRPVTWNDSQISGTCAVGVPNCAVQQRNALPAQCGELVNHGCEGKTSVDTVTVTIVQEADLCDTQLPERCLVGRRTQVHCRRRSTMPWPVT